MSIIGNNSTNPFNFTFALHRSNTIRENMA